MCRLSGRICLLFFAIAIFFCHCDTVKRKKMDSPEGYNFSTGKKLFLSGKLEEVSGIAFVPNSDSVVMAINDEEGIIFTVQLHAPKKKNGTYKFYGPGDFEDIAYYKGKWLVLESNGVIHLADIINDTVLNPVSILPKGEYESLAVYNDELYAICKDCPKTKKYQSPVFIIKNMGDSMFIDRTITLDAGGFMESKNKKILASALAMHPITKQWYILSHLNNCLVIADENFKVLQHISLVRSLFLQPEGIAFKPNGDLYISNEGDESSGYIIEFKYAHPAP
jgi:uncharacterized protein YjiK